MRNPDPNKLRELFEYDPETGVLTRKPCHQNKWLPAQIVGKNTDGYLVASVGGTVHKAHRIAWAIAYGAWPEGEVDHINRVRTDNRLVNLRDVGKRGNALNRGNVAGFSEQKDGPRDRPFRARIRVGTKDVHLGYFASAAEAQSAYAEAKSKLL